MKAESGKIFIMAQNFFLLSKNTLVLHLS